MKKVYIILTYTGTVLSKAIKYVTKHEYSHVSIALDEELEQMYSFGRLNPYNPFIAGFVHEKIESGTFKRFYNTKTAVYEMEVEDDQYDKICHVIQRMERSNKIYTYNIVGVVAAAFDYKFKKLHSFYCSEFVKHVLETAKIQTQLPDIAKPEDFEMLNMELKYEGKLQEYRNRKGIFA